MIADGAHGLMNTCNTSLDIDILFQLRTDFNCLLMNLIVGELLVSMFGIPVDAWAAIRQGWKLGYHLCITLGFSLTLLGEILANILLSIDIEWIQRSRCTSISSAHSILFYGKIAHHYHWNFIWFIIFRNELNIISDLYINISVDSSFKTGNLFTFL